MRKNLIALMFGILLLGLTSAAVKAAELTNVAINKPVTLNGVFYYGGWPGAYAGSKETVVDGQFMSQSHEWDMGTVYWNYYYGPDQSIDVDLNGVFKINSFIVQADDNDQYLLYYKNLNTNQWDLAWDIPAVGGWGMQTRPDKSDNSQQYVLPSEIMTNALRIKGGQTDQWYSVSELQAFGAPVPEPSSVLLGLMSLGGLLGLRRKKEK